MKPDVISILEAAYAECDLKTWFNGVADAACPVLDVGYGLLAHDFRMNPSRDTVRVTHIATSSLPASAERHERVIRVSYDRWPVVEGALTVSSKAFTFAPWAGLLSERIGVHDPVLREVDPSGASGADMFGVLAGEPSGEGMGMFVHVDVAKRPSEAQRRLWTMVAVHLAAGHRIARTRSHVDAVLRADGRVEHAEKSARSPEAQDALRDAAKAMDRARGRLRRANAVDAVALWRGLVDGKWSLVDHVDSDGKRFLFAKCNAPDVRPWQKLTERERQVLAYAAEGHSHKLIGYELGISESTSARHLMSAARKVGARSRLELIRTFRASQART